MSDLQYIIEESGEQVRKLFNGLANFDHLDHCEQTSVQFHARKFLDKMFIRSEQKLNDIAFTHSPEALHHFIEGNYKRAMQMYERWKNGAKYSKDKTRYIILQQAPSKLIDGYWLKNVHKLSDGTVGDGNVRTILNRIYLEEMGEGDEEKNHVNIYRKLTKECCLHLSEMESEEFAFDFRINAESFLSPILQLSLALLQEDYFPELLGFSLQFEETALSILQMMDAVKEAGWNSYYYILHLTIDNPCCGHSHQVEEAINLYLNYIRLQKTERYYAIWRRILRGYISATIITNIIPNENHREKEYIRLEMIKLIKKYKPYAACPIHSRVKLCGNSNLAVCMENNLPEEFLNKLERSHWIVPEQPEKSLLCKSMEFGRKMYKVFSESDQEVIRRWIASLDAKEMSKDNIKQLKRCTKEFVISLQHYIFLILVGIIMMIFLLIYEIISV